MARGKKYRSTIKRMKEVRQITREHYEPGNQAKCLKAVWSRHVEPRYGICYDTFLSYVNGYLPAEPKEPDDKQQTLFDL